MKIVPKNFTAVRIDAVKPLALADMFVLIANATNPLIVVSKQVSGGSHSTNAFDEKTRTLYRATHQRGVLSAVKQLARGNQAVRLLSAHEHAYNKHYAFD